MAKRRFSKAKNQAYHFKMRCEERLGCQVDRKLIQRKIKEHRYDENFYLLDRQTNRVTRYRYKFNNEWYIIPYDKDRHKVITIFKDKKQDIVHQETAINIETKKESSNFFIQIFRFIFEKIKKIFRWSET